MTLYYVQKIYSSFDPGHGIDHNIETTNPTTRYIEALDKYNEWKEDLFDSVVDNYKTGVPFDEDDYDGEMFENENGDRFTYEDQSCGEPWKTTIKLIMIDVK